jgi:hypothetical protein
MNMPGFSAESSLRKTSKQYYAVGAHITQINGGKVIPQATPKWLLRFLGFCTLECYPILNCNPYTGRCVVEYTCVEKCIDPFERILV